MENIENTYCRFCAEPKGADKVLNLQNDGEKCNDIILKLAFVNALYVNVNDDSLLPKTVCFVCYDSLNKAYEFLDRVKRSQDVLFSLFSLNECHKQSTSEDERTCSFDDYIVHDTSLSTRSGADQSSVKQWPCNKNKNVQLDDNVPSFPLDIKKEPKEEISDTILEGLSKGCSPVDDYSENLDVNDIIEAAISNVPSNIVLYAKDFSEMRKKDVKTWQDYPWVCAFCNIEFLDMDTLRSHSKAVHGKCSPFVCIDCQDVKKNSFSSFMKHVRKHRKSLRNYCYYCHEHIDKTESLSVHVKQHYQKPLMPCPLCGEILKNEEGLKFHLQEYNISKCKRRPRRKPGTPITIEELTCPLCKKVYKNPNSLRDHMKLHTEDRKRNYTCDRCGKMFYNKGTLTSHIMSHDKVRPHLCRICNKSFLFPNMLRRHVEMHSGIKPFSCEQCGRCFRLQYQLNAHKIVHTDSMPYVCQYCNKAFRFKQILKNHERQHTGAKPYSCNHCGMEFTNWSNYNKHMKRRHGMDTSKKKITPEGVFPINPETGQIIRVEDPVGTEEWKNKIMVPAKRGKKKVIK
ncbi:unnamed protein product [Chilo suppressalis]|uniref:Uncharacterized protein n=1 Tax=Chilo suppressalis TaxID=168631 RepID=A0ABN8L5R5_CHISP|nr:unnamed protein product [Chilo suppressalis]